MLGVKSSGKANMLSRLVGGFPKGLLCESLVQDVQASLTTRDRCVRLKRVKYMRVRTSLKYLLLTTFSKLVGQATTRKTLRPFRFGSGATAPVVAALSVFISPFAHWVNDIH